MKTILFSLLLIICSLVCSSQTTPKVISATAESEDYWKQWTVDLYERGVELTKDSLKINSEAKKVLADANYRKVIYPKAYTWQIASTLMKQMELKKAFWYLLNLYSTDTTNKRLVINSVLAFDQLYEMDKAMTASFYSYALLDPLVCDVKNGRPQIVNPVELEKKFADLKQIVGYVQLYRKQKKDN
jgi:hypothetical protein